MKSDVAHRLGADGVEQGRDAARARRESLVVFEEMDDQARDVRDMESGSSTGWPVPRRPPKPRLNARRNGGNAPPSGAHHEADAEPKHPRTPDAAPRRAPMLPSCTRDLGQEAGARKV